ncbi:hypothetical protein [Maridesulfovibrio sp.]|uniref:hypothetical protein n=1 Tax=Maridesulfovibrio sp. TaxID=2795000 RepID=UPI002A18D711|nr:hypothetical protein [Maridesulfovibrio sp.]
MRILTLIFSAVLLCTLLVSAAQANDLCTGKEGTWIVAPTQDPNFGNFYLGGMCDNNSCYHVTISTDANGEEMVGLAFTCEDIGDGSKEKLWVFVDVETGEKQEVQATLQDVNTILHDALNQ